MKDDKRKKPKAQRKRRPKAEPKHRAKGNLNEPQLNLNEYQPDPHQLQRDPYEPQPDPTAQPVGYRKRHIDLTVVSEVDHKKIGVNAPKKKLQILKKFKLNQTIDIPLGGLLNMYCEQTVSC